MEQTAVEWLVDELKQFGTHVPNLWFKQAKEMEKQQIIDACKYGNNFEQGDLNCHNYYDKTFKNK